MPRDTNQRDPLGRAFARLTAELEDTTSLAVNGQNSRLKPSARSNLVARIRKRLTRVSAILDLIDQWLIRDGATR